jgi:hypothetical protein
VIHGQRAREADAAVEAAHVRILWSALVNAPMFVDPTEGTGRTGMRDRRFPQRAFTNTSLPEP